MKAKTKKTTPKPNRTNRTRFSRYGKKAVTRARADKWPERFIAELRKRGIVLDACKATKISRDTAYQLRETSKEFARQWASALEEAGDVMEAEAFRRAVKGVRKPVYQQGKRVGYVQEYSDGLLTLMLKAHRPSKFREKTQVEHSGEIGLLTPEQIEARRKDRWSKVGPALSAALMSQMEQGQNASDLQGASDA